MQAGNLGPHKQKTETWLSLARRLVSVWTCRVQNATVTGTIQKRNPN